MTPTAGMTEGTREAVRSRGATRLGALGLALALAFGALIAAGCGKTDGEQSGETHFLSYCAESCAAGSECLCGVCTARCESSADCAGSAANATCAGPIDRVCDAAPLVCDVRCSEDADCASLGGGARCRAGACRRGSPPPDANGCAPGCRAVRGYPEDASRGCIDLERSAAVACSCDEAVVGSQCFRKSADDSLWMLDADTVVEAAAFVPCSTEERGRIAVSSCDFAGCALPPASICSAADTCTAHGCDNPQFDENGCARAPCNNDGECAAGEHCVYQGVIHSGFCSYSSGGSCDCAGPGIAISGAFCNPDSVPGLGPICDGTTNVRLAATQSGGFVDWSTPFLGAYGLNALFIDGQCRYWVDSDWNGVLKSGVLTETQADELMQGLGWQSFPAWSAFNDVQSCSDAGSTDLHAPGVELSCSCSCDAGAPAGLADALALSVTLTDDYGAMGAPLDGAVRVVSVAYEPDSAPPVTPLEWPLAWNVADVAVTSLSVQPSDGRRIDDPAEAAALRALRAEHLMAGARTPEIRVLGTDGLEYGVLVRDELPEDVAASALQVLGR